MNTGFLDKLIERIGRIRPEEVQDYFLRLAREKGFLETIFNAVREGVIVTDLAGRVSYLNDAACGLFGLEREHVMGGFLSDHVKGIDWAAFASSDQVMTRDVEIFYPQHRFLNFYVAPLSLEKPSHPAGHEEAAGAANGADQEGVGYAIILRDITENRRTTEETIESERLSALTLLAAGVAHEIGNPLNSLHIHMQLLERQLRKLPEENRAATQELIEVAREEIKRLDYIVNQFLRAIRPVPLDIHPENMNAVVQESVSFLAAEIEDRNILVEQELRSDLPPVPIDRNQMKQAFYNVIKNAFQAMKSEGILHIKTDRDDHFVSITFSDTGGGISPGNMSRIFEPYFTTKSSGSGLGLLIVRRVVREHGGEINIASNEGKGLTLTIRLPLGVRQARLLEGGAARPAHHLPAFTGAEAARENTQT